MDANVALFMFFSVVVAVVFSFVAVVVWLGQRRKEREVFYRSETIKKLAESSGSDAALEFLRESNRISIRNLRNAFRLAGLVVIAVGVSVMVFLRAMEPSGAVYLAGFIPLCVGVVLFAYAQIILPRE